MRLLAWRLASLLLLLTAAVVWSQVQFVPPEGTGTGTGDGLTVVAIGSLPASPTDGQSVTVTDAINFYDCSLGDNPGGPESVHICTYNATTAAWVPAAGDDAFETDGELVNPEVSTGNFIFNGAGPPAAGSCPHNKATYRDTVTLGDTYVCYGIGENWHLIGENDDTFGAVTPDAGSPVVTSGSTNLTLTGTAPLSFVGNNTTKTISTIFTGEKCAVIDNVTSTDDLKLLASFVSAVTITSVWCNYEGSAPGTAATFLLFDGAGNAMTITGSNPTCAAKTGPATAAAVTAANALTAREVLLFSVSNTPSPATDTYMLCVGYTIP